MSEPPVATRRPSRTAALVGEFVGTALLLATVVGSGIMATRLTDDVGLQLLINSFATAAVLTALILAFGAISGAHLNPAVSLADLALGGIDRRTCAAYAATQTAGAALGVVVANLMFDLPAVEWSTTDRSAAHLVLADGVATFGLVTVIFLIVRRGDPRTVAFAVGGYIGGAYFFTSSTSFANPAVTLARTLSDTFAGIAPASVPAFVAAQLVATAAAVAAVRTMAPDADQSVLDDPPAR